MNLNHEEILTHLGNGSDDNIGALFYGRYVDIDVDTDDPLMTAALNHYLPPTPYMWGRYSKPNSHRVYQLMGDFDRNGYGTILRQLKNESLVEMRGGKPENGMYSVLPGSIHPSGEEYQWGGTADLSVSVPIVEGYVLVRALRFSAAAALVARYWSAGSRNDLCLALSGLLWRIRTNSLSALGLDNEHEAEDAQFLLTEAASKEFFSTVMELGADDPRDRGARLLTFVNTWNKLNRDPTARVSGGKILAELIGEQGDEVVKRLYRLLSDNPDIAALEAVLEQFVMWYGPGVIIDLNLVEAGSTVPWMKKEQALASLAGRRLTLGKKKVPTAALLFSSNQVRRVAGLTFDPSTEARMVETPEGVMINQWRGFEVKAHEAPVSDAEVEPFLYYLNRVIADGDEKSFNWTLAWMADLFQRPAQKAGTALVLVGVQGAGKSFLGEQVIGAIIGKGHYAQTNSIGQLTDKFNSIVDNKIFIQCDEAIHNHQREVASRLKSIITDKTLTIEPKGVNSFKKPNHLHMLFTSNEEHAAIFIDASPHERRFTVLKVSSKYAKDLDYWKTMHEWIGANRSKLLRWFLDYEYDKELIRRPLLTEAKRTMQKVGMDPEISWILSCLQNGHILSIKGHKQWFDAFDPDTIRDQDKVNNTLNRGAWPKVVSITALEADYKAFIREHGRPVYSGSVLTSLKRVLPVRALPYHSTLAVTWADARSGQVTRGAVRLHTMPTREEIVEFLKKRYGEALVGELNAMEEIVEEPRRAEGEF